MAEDELDVATDVEEKEATRIQRQESGRWDAKQLQQCVGQHEENCKEKEEEYEHHRCHVAHSDERLVCYNLNWMNQARKMEKLGSWDDWRAVLGAVHSK